MPEIRLPPPIAQGRTADVYAWEGETILKLFHSWFSLESIEYEARLARAVHAGGLPVPQVGDMIQVNGRNGLIYSRVHGQTMGEALLKKPWRLTYFASRLAELQAQMHASGLAIAIPLQRQRLVEKILQAGALSEQVRAAVLVALKTLPDGDRICHGDFHPGNILVAAQGEVIIDWIDATLGNPLADVARTSIILSGTVGSSQVTNPALKLYVRRFHAVYLRNYFRLRPGGETEYRRWLPVIAAARLSEGISELENWLIGQAQAVLSA